MAIGPETSSERERPIVERDLASARSAGLSYVTDQQTGIRRLRSRSGFRYIGIDGRPVKDIEALRRIRALAIPPAWTSVWICPSAAGHVQATGRDARGRKQYRYHRQWREVRDENKFHRMIAFGRLLPVVRGRIARDLEAPGLGRNKVLATLVRLLDLSAIRVGNDEYAHHNKSYGLTTLQDRHAKVNGSTIHLHFRGKAGRQHVLTIEDPGLARIVKRCQDLPGQELFQWRDKQGTLHDVTSGDVNAYLAEISGEVFTSKDFRTWTGTVLAAREFHALGEGTSRTRARGNIGRAIAGVAARLGNTPAVCRKCYIHPAILEAYQDGTLLRSMRRAGKSKPASPGPHLGRQEAVVLAVLRRKARDESGDHLQKKLEASLRRAKVHRV